MNTNIVKIITKSVYQCNIYHDCCGNVISWKLNPTIRAAIPSNSAPNPTPSSGSGTTQYGGKWSNYGVDPSLFVGGSGFIHRRNGKTICNGRVGGFSPNPIRHWRKQLIPRQGGCSGKNSVSNMQDTPGSSITLTDNVNFSGNYSDIYINKTLSIKELCEINGGFCKIENMKKRSRPIPTYSNDYHSSSNTYLQSRGKLYTQQSAINFKKIKNFPCKKLSETDYIGLYNTDVSNCFFTDSSCAVSVVYDPVNTVFGTNTAVAGSLYAQNKSRVTFTENQYNIINRWGLDGVSITKIYPLVRSKAPGYQKLNGGTGIRIISCPAFIQPLPFTGTGKFIFTLSDTLWTQIVTALGSDISSIPIISNLIYPYILPINVEPNYALNNGITKVTVDYIYDPLDPSNCGFTMKQLLINLRIAGIYVYNINIIQWGAIPFANTDYLFSQPEIIPTIISPPIWSGANTAIIQALPITVPPIDSPLILSTCNLINAFRWCLIPSGNFGNINIWDVTNISDISEMFSHCTYFNQNLGNWNTINFTNINSAFEYCENNSGSGLDKWKIPIVTTMNSSFESNFLFNQDLSGWDVSNCQYFNATFKNCLVFQGTGLNIWKPHPITMNSTFNNCSLFNPLNLIWDVSNCTTFVNTFNNCIAFQGNGLSTWRPNSVTDMSGMFYNCQNFNQDLSGWNITTVTSQPMIGLFNNCIGLSVVNITSILVGWGKQNITYNGNILDMSSVKYYVDKYGVLDLSNNYSWVYQNAIPTHIVPSYLAGKTNWQDAYLNNIGSSYPSISGDLIVTQSDFSLWRQDASIVTDFNNMFLNCTNLSGLGFQLWNTSKAVIFDDMFNGCINFNQDLSGWNTSKGTSFIRMFKSCSSFTGQGLNTWTTSLMINPNSMFYGCNNFNTNINNWNTNNATNFINMFYGCTIFNQPLNKWNVLKITDMSGMFYNCNNFNQDLSGWNTLFVSNMSNMFTNCTNFNQNLARWNMYSLFYADNMLNNCGMSIQNYTNLLYGWGNQSIINIDVHFGASNLYYYHDGIAPRARLKNIYNWTITDLGTSPPFNPTISGLTDWSYMFLGGIGSTTDPSYVDVSGILIVSGSEFSIWDSSMVTNVTSMFQNCNLLYGWGIQTWITSKIISASNMFSGCTNFNQDLSGWNTSKITNAANLFNNCSSFTGQGLQIWDTSSVTNISGMFKNNIVLNNLITIDLSGWKTSHVTTMNSTFYNCPKFIGKGLQKWNTTAVTDISGMFFNCSQLNQSITLDLSGWQTSLVTTMNSTFQGCSNFIGQGLDKWITSSLTTMDYMFYNCSKLNQSIILDLSWNTSQVTTMNSTFQGCTNFIGEGLPLWDTSNVKYMTYMFQNCLNFNQNLSDWNISDLLDATSMLDNCNMSSQKYSLLLTKWAAQTIINIYVPFGAASIKYYSWAISSRYILTNMYTWNITDAGIDTLQIGFPPSIALLTNWSSMFIGGIGSITNPSYIDVSGYIVTAISDYSMWISNIVTNTNQMFQNCINFVGIGLPFWNTSSITTMIKMFNGCQNLSGQNLSGWNVQNVTTMNGMFQGCSNFQGTGLNAWHMPLITDVSGMFYNASNFNQNLSGWAQDISNATNFNAMFYNCSKFIGTGLSSWNISHAINLSQMFENDICFNQNISSWDTSNVTTMTSMFYNASSFNQDLSGWNITSLTDATNMFIGSAFSIQNFTNLLNGWAAQTPNIQYGVRLDVSGTLTYLSAAGNSYYNLTHNYNWIINSGGESPFPMPSSIGALPDWSYMFVGGIGSTTIEPYKDVSGVIIEATKNFVNWVSTNVIKFTQMFQYCTSFVGIGLSSWIVANATNILGMFDGCTIFNQDLSGWNTSNVTTMNSVFNNCSNFIGTGLNNWNTSKVIDISGMLQNCPKFNQNLSGWAQDISKVTIMNSTFANDVSFIGQGLSLWKTPLVTDTRKMFLNCTTFNQNLSSWNISSLTNANNMLDYCGMSAQNYSDLLIGWDSQAPAINSNVTFGTKNLQIYPWASYARTDLSNTYLWVIDDNSFNTTQPGFSPAISALTNWSNMFVGGIGSTTNPLYVDISGYIVTAISDYSSWISTIVINFEQMFQNSSTFVGIGLSLWKTPAATNITRMLQNCSNFNQDLSGWNTSNVITMNSVFENCTQFQGTGLYKWNTSNVTTMDSLFNNCNNFNQDLSGWNIKFNLTTAAHMLDNTNMSVFNMTAILLNWYIKVQNNAGLPINILLGISGQPYYEQKYNVLNLKNIYNWDICGGIPSKIVPSYLPNVSWSNGGPHGLYEDSCGNAYGYIPWNPVTYDLIVPTSDFSLWALDCSLQTNISLIFLQCSTFQGIGLPLWKTQNVTDMNSIFSGCAAFNQDLSGWNTNLVTNMNSLFNGCSAFNQNLTNWTTNLVTNMGSMFQNCNIFTGEGLSTWNTSIVTNMSYMFNGCSDFSQNLTSWTTPNITTMNSTFQNCANFTGQGLSTWNTHNVTSMNSMLNQCVKFNQNLSGWNISSLIDATNMLNDTSMSVQNYSLLLYQWAAQIPLIQLGVSFGASNLKYSNFAVSARALLTGTYNWTITDAGIDASSVPFPPSIAALTNWSYMFFGSIGSTTNPSYIDISGFIITATTDFTIWISTNVLNMQSMFQNCSSFLGLGLNTWNTQNVIINPILYWNTSHVINMTALFYGCANFTGQGLTNWDTSIVKNMNAMFSGCTIFNQNLTLWITSLVTNMSSMFLNCTSFQGTGINNWTVTNVTDMAAMFYHCSNINFNPNLGTWTTHLVTNMSNMFLGCSNFIGTGLQNWDVSNVTNMRSMFYNCIILYSSLNLSGWITYKVTNMNYMFGNCQIFLGNGLPLWNTSNVTNMSSMFFNCQNFNQDLSWNTSQVTNTSYMFYNCINFQGQGLNLWNTSIITNMSYMFFNCQDFSQNLISWITNSVTNMMEMFYNCISFTGVGLSTWNTSAVINTSYMFDSCSIFNQDLNGWITSQVTNMSYMFNKCSVFLGTGLPIWNISNVTTATHMFNNCSLFNQDLSGWDTTKIINMDSMFNNCSLFNQDLGNWNISSLKSAVNMLNNTNLSVTNYSNLLIAWAAQPLIQVNVIFGASNLKYNSFGDTARAILTGPTYNWTITDDGLDTTLGFPPSIAALTDWSSMFVGGIGSTTNPVYVDMSGYIVDATSNFIAWISTNVTNMQLMFKNCSNFLGLGLNTWTTQNVTMMQHMFFGCSNFDTSLNWNTSQVKNMDALFYGCANFTGQGLTIWDTSNVTTMDGMFNSCILFNQNLALWNTSLVTNMSDMFLDCSSFQGNGLNTWNTSIVNNMSAMFYHCSNFNQDLSGWDTLSVTNMNNMFQKCIIFTGTGLTYWDVSNVTSMNAMFYKCSLFNQDLSGWNISSLTTASSMLNNCGMSTVNYSNLLIGWAAQAPNINTGVNLGANTLTYTGAAAIAGRLVLTGSPYYWVITGDIPI